jgi:hypothetical protein
MDGKRSFHANAVGDFTDRKGFRNTFSLSFDDEPFKGLDTLFGTLDDANVHFDIVAWSKLMDILA